MSDEIDQFDDLDVTLSLIRGYIPPSCHDLLKSVFYDIFIIVSPEFGNECARRFADNVRACGGLRDEETLFKNLCDIQAQVHTFLNP